MERTTTRGGWARLAGEAGTAARVARGAAVARGALLALVALVALGAADCREPETPRSPETIAVEEKAGSFLDYYEEVLTLARRHAAHPDSFRAALDSLPGSHLTDEEWRAWTAPYETDAAALAERLEKTIGELSQPIAPPD
jgi:hypothetical protein